MVERATPTGPTFFDLADGRLKALHLWGDVWWVFCKSHGGEWFSERKLTVPDAVALVLAAEKKYPVDLRICSLIDELRAEDGCSIQLLCDNPDPPPKNAVNVSGDWTNWEDRRFEGETLIDCLRAAAAAKRAWRRPSSPESSSGEIG